MRAWLSFRFSSPVAVLPAVTRGLAVIALAGGFAVLAAPAWSGASAAPLVKAALTSQSGAPAADRCDGADLRSAGGRAAAPLLEARRDHALRQPTLNRAAPANDDLRRFSRAF
jgi:hypothetical protein